MFPCDNIQKTFTVMHNPVFEHSGTLSFALLACIILYINGKQFRCSVFTFVQYICISHNYATPKEILRNSTTVTSLIYSHTRVKHTQSNMKPCMLVNFHFLGPDYALNITVSSYFQYSASKVWWIVFFN